MVDENYVVKGDEGVGVNDSDDEIKVFPDEAAPGRVTHPPTWIGMAATWVEHFPSKMSSLTTMAMVVADWAKSPYEREVNPLLCGLACLAGC